MDEGRFSISATSLNERLGGPAAPILIDVRRTPTFDADPWMVVGAIRRPPEAVVQWGGVLPKGRPVVVYCAHGLEIGRDTAACPWLIRRFIDPEASFLFVPTEQVFDVARATGAIAYDIPGAEPFSHDGELCSFDTFLKVYGIADAALDTLAVIVRGADTARLELAPQAPGLLALSLGLSANFANDHEMLEHGLTMYDAFYAWCRSCQDEKHNWTPAAA
jgi:hypothetical protein